MLSVNAGCTLAQDFDGLSDALNILDAWTANRVLSHGLPGLSIGIVVGDKLVWARGYGYADLRRKTPATPQTLFGIRSVTKTFTALAILQLREVGKLQLDDPVTRYLPQVHILKHSPGSPDITIRELLTHTSGLERDAPGTVWTEGTFSTDADLMLPLLQVYEPDTRWYYSNLGFALLGKVVEVQSHQSWSAYIQQHILIPLQMTNTLPVPKQNEPGLAVGYVRTVPGGAVVPADPAVLWPGGPTAIDAAGAMASNVQDLAKYIAFHLTEGSNGNSSVLSGPTLREMHRPQWLLPGWQESWGLGMRVCRTNGHLCVGHAGGGIYAASVYFVPDLKLGVIVLSNSEDDELGDYRDYIVQLLAPFLNGSSPQAQRRLAGDFKRFVGLYEAKNHLGRMLVASLDGNLILLAPDEANPRAGGTLLQPTDKPKVFFQREPDLGPSSFPGEKLIFDVSADDTVIGFHTDHVRYLRIGSL
ncbi:MAG TPA: serine hydrolase domain-containing protein [Candidatus Acidoferrum sp.]